MPQKGGSSEILTKEKVEAQVASLNVELLEHLTQALKWTIAYADANDIALTNIEALYHLLERAQALIKEIAATNAFAYLPSSDAFIHPKASDEDSPEPFTRLCFIFGTRFRVLTSGT
jgi:hypothetical protein